MRNFQFLIRFKQDPGPDMEFENRIRCKIVRIRHTGNQDMAFEQRRMEIGDARVPP